LVLLSLTDLNRTASLVSWSCYVGKVWIPYNLRGCWWR